MSLEKPRPGRQLLSKVLGALSVRRPPASCRVARRRTVLASAACLVYTASLLAQNGPDNDANGAPGFTNSIFEAGQIDSVNLYNGQLTIPIPIGPSYPIGPKLRMQLTLNYNSRVDDNGRPANQSDQFWYKPLVGNPSLGTGWDLTMGAIKFCKHGGISAWCYAAPDGSQHVFDMGSKSGDGSQFFLSGSGPFDMWDGDGNHYEFDWEVDGYDDSSTNYTHDFGMGRDGWYLTKLTDPFGNFFTVDYYDRTEVSTPLWTYGTATCSPSTITTQMKMLNPAATNTWIIKDIGLPSTSAVHVNTGTVNGITGMITSVNLPVLVDGSSVTRTWTLVYEPSFLVLNKSCNGILPVNVQRLKELQLPSDLTGAPKYQFAHPGGLLTRITLPTAGFIEYCYGSYTFYHASAGHIPPGCPGFFPDQSKVAVDRSLACILPPSLPDPQPNIPGGCVEDNPATWKESRLGVITRRETVGSVQNETNYVQYAFPWGERGSVWPNSDPAQTLTVVISPPTDTKKDSGTDGGRRRARAVLFETATSLLTPPPDQQPPIPGSVPGDRVGADVEERVFELDPTTGPILDPPCTDDPATSSAFCGSKAIRTTKKTYEYANGATGGQRRLIQEKTIYGPSHCATCPYHQVTYTNTGTNTWDGNGRHFNVETHTGTLGGDARTITTVWSPQRWASNPSSLTVLPNNFDQRTTVQGSTHIQYFDFDTDDGFLTGDIVWDSGRSIAFVNCRVNDADGNVDKDFSKTQGSLPARTYCSTAGYPTVGTDGDIFGRDYTWQNGELLTARWVNGSVGTSTFKFKDYVRHSTTGWITSSADTSGRTTSYTYDSLGRVNEITPPAAGERKTWICYEGPNATTAYRAVSE